MVPCLTDEMGQVFLSILVNAGHTIADKVQGIHDKGYISIRIADVDGVVEIVISDTGKGMDDELCGKIFDRFFTINIRRFSFHFFLIFIPASQTVLGLD